MLGAKTFTSFFLFLLLPLNNFVVGTQHLAWVQTTTYPPPPPLPIPFPTGVPLREKPTCTVMKNYLDSMFLNSGCSKTSTNFNKISVEVQRLPASALVVFVTVERSFVTESENNSNQQKHFGD